MKNENLNLEIGKRIYDRRKSLGITQEQLAELAKTTPQAISNYERGESELIAGTVIKIANALDTDCNFVLTGSRNSGFAQEELSEKKLEYIEKILKLVIRLAK